MDHKAALKVFLSEISEEAKYISFDYQSSSHYVITLRCKVENNQTKAFYDEYSKRWLSKFSKFTSTTWIVRHSFPRIQRLQFRKLFCCQRSQFNKKRIEESKTNVGCKAIIDFKVLLMSKHTIKNDPMRRLGYNMTIVIKFLHTHNLWDSEALGYLKTYSGVDDAFCKYLREGMSPVIAKQFHNLVLLAQYGKNSAKLASKATNPNLHHVIYLQGKIKGKEPDLELNAILSEKQNTLEAEGFITSIKDGKYIIITPFMKRVIIYCDTDIMLIDTTQVNIDFVTIIYVTTKIGALPIASAIHSTKDTDVLNNIVGTVKTMMEKVIERELKLEFVMATDQDDDCLMNTVTPRNTNVSELWKDISKWPKKQRRNIIDLIDSMLNLEVPEGEKIYEAIIQIKELRAIKEDDSNCSTLVKLESLWYDRQFEVLGTSDNFYILVRITKQFFTTKCKSFNATIMMDVISNVLEKYWRQIVIAHCENKELSPVYTALLTNSDVEANNTKSIWFCDCTEGLKGEFCGHLLANIEDTIKVELDPEDIKLFIQIAGEESHSNTEIDYEITLDVKNEMEDQAIEEEMDQTEIVDNIYYAEVKNEDGYDPLDNCEAIKGLEVPERLENYKKSINTLNAEFYRLNRMFRANPNEPNIDTMMRLAKELSKIQPDNSGEFEDN